MSEVPLFLVYEASPPFHRTTAGTAYQEEVYLAMTLVPSDTASLASSPEKKQDSEPPNPQPSILNPET